MLLGGNSSPVSPHLHQNGFNNPSGNNVSSGNTVQVTGSQPSASIGQNYTAAQGTWTGSNTLTYTQSMQPPDNRTHHTSYCNIN